MDQSSILISNFTSLSYIVEAVMVLMGVSLVVTGMFKFKRYGEMRSMMSQQVTITGPLFCLFAGVMLLIFPNMVHIVMGMLWTNTNPLSYQPNGSSLAGYIQALIIFVRLIGSISFIRGVVLLSRFGGQQGQPVLGKALIFMISGILALHIIGTVDLFEAIFDFSF
jgi:hypothetical protein